MYYDKIEAIVRPQLKGYSSDLELDKKLLKCYTSSALHCYRSMGTNLLLMTPDSLDWMESRSSIEEQLEIKKHILFYANSGFLYCHDGQVVPVSKEKADEIFEDFKAKMLLFQKSLKEYNVELMANELMLFKEMKGRTWRSQLREYWSSGRLLEPSLQRVRNQCPQILNRIKKDMGVSSISNLIIDSYIKKGMAS